MATSADDSAGSRPGVGAILLWVAILIGLPFAVAGMDGFRKPAAAPETAIKPPTPPPPVEPLELYALDADQARAFNAAVPFSTLPNPPARPFRFAGTDTALTRATDCLAAAQWYEAGDDPDGERAVAQVVLNRLRHPAFPKTVCGVVFQGSERATGCQFTFTCDGALARTPSAEAWARARKIAAKALTGSVDRKIGYSTHYHTDWVVPYWSGSLDKVTSVGTHLFFRWTGWWGTPPAFRRTVDGEEPAIPLLARLSPAHGAADAPVDPAMPAPVALASAPLRTFASDAIGKSFGGARLTSMDVAAGAFLVAIDRALPADDYPTLVDTFCGGRPRCRIMGWTDTARAPKAFPVDPAALPSMTFSYIHDAATGLRRALWNCDQFPRTDTAQCMREREPMAVPIAIPAAIALPAKATSPAANSAARSEKVIIKPAESTRPPAP
jgi:hypothetical protein